MVELKKVIRCTSYLILLLILFSVLSTAALAGNGAGTGNNEKNEKMLETFQKKNLVKEENQSRNQSEKETTERVQLREESQKRAQLKEELKLRRNNYQSSKKNFLAIRKNLRSGNYDEKDLNITREFLNESIDYMIAHLEKVQFNMEQSNGNGTEARIAAIEERISQLQKEKQAIEKAETLEDLRNSTKSVRGVWNNARNGTVVETGQTACEKIDGFVNKSGYMSNKIEKEIERMNKKGVNTTNLESKLANYNSLMDSARENKEAAEDIYNNGNAAEVELQKADSHLQNALKEIKEANQVLKEIFVELKPYREQYRLNENNKKTAQTNGENVDETGDDKGEEKEENGDVVATNSSEEETDK